MSYFVLLNDSVFAERGTLEDAIALAKQLNRKLSGNGPIWTRSWPNVDIISMNAQGQIEHCWES